MDGIGRETSVCEEARRARAGMPTLALSGRKPTGQLGSTRGGNFIRPVVTPCSLEQIAEVRMGHFDARGTHINDTRQRPDLSSGEFLSACVVTFLFSPIDDVDTRSRILKPGKNPPRPEPFLANGRLVGR